MSTTVCNKPFYNDFYFRKPPKFVKLGGRDLLTSAMSNSQKETNETNIKVEEVIVHPQYDPNLAYHDIALIKLESDAQ